MMMRNKPKLIEELKQEYLDDNNLFLSRLIDELHKLGAPIVFKGSMIIQYMTKNIPNRLYRKTVDVDCNWNIDELHITMQELTDYIVKAVHNIDPDIQVEVKRNFDIDNNVSAGFKISYRNLTLGKLDVSIRADYFDDIYITYENSKIKGAHLFKILADKLSAVSSRKIFSRFKDLFDLYIIAYNSNEIFDTEDILLTASLTNRKIGDFNSFIHDKDQLAKAYSKFKRVSVKPDFELLYSKMFYSLKPFFNSSNTPYLIWHNKKWHTV